jgi:acetoacetyl-CoA synthetase
MHHFMRLVNQKHNLQLKQYDDLHDWSINNLAAFWSEVWDFTRIKASVPYSQVCPQLV